MLSATLCAIKVVLLMQSTQQTHKGFVVRLESWCKTFKSIYFRPIHLPVLR